MPKLHRRKRIPHLFFYRQTSALDISHIHASAELCVDFESIFQYCLFYMGENQRENKIHVLNSAHVAPTIL